jgi:hypothetical protein
VESVYSAVRTESLYNIKQVRSTFERLMKGILLLRPNSFSWVCPHALERVNKICHMALPPHELRAVHVSCKSVSNERHFTVVALYSVFHPCLPSHWRGVTEICHVVLPAHALRGVQFRLKMVSNEGHFTYKAERVFRPYLHSHCSGANEIFNMGLPAHAVRTAEVRLKTVSNELQFTLKAERVFRLYLLSHCLVAEI